jgi:hypothetical protein
VTFCVQLERRPAPSMADHVTLVVPTPKTADALLETLAAPQLSDAKGVLSAGADAEHCPASAVIVKAVGQVSVGGVLSSTVMTTVSRDVEVPSDTASSIAFSPWTRTTAGFGPSTVPNGPVHAYFRGSPSGSLEAVPSSVTIARHAPSAGSV